MPVTSITLNVDQLAEIRDVVNVALGRSVEFDTVSTDGTTLLQRLECDISGNAATASAAEQDSALEVAINAKADLSAMNTALATKFDAPSIVSIIDIKQIGQSILGTSENEQLGRAVSMNADGTIVAVGSYMGGTPNATLAEGRVTVYKRNETTGDWDKMGQDIYGPNGWDQAGWSVSLSDDGLRLAVGINRNDTTAVHSGMVRVYQYDADGGNDGNGQWDQMGSDLDLVGTGQYQYFGHAVSLSGNGNFVAVGATEGNQDAYTDYVKVYKWNPPVEGQTDGSWTQEGAMLAGLYQYNDSTGDSVSLNHDGSVIAIGVSNANTNGVNSGMVRVYKRNADDMSTPIGWTQIGHFAGSWENDEYGTSVSLSDNRDDTNNEGKMRLAISAPYHSGNLGHVQVYEYVSDNNWSRLGSDIDGTSIGGNFGISVSLSLDGNTVAIGVPSGVSAQGSYSGHVRIYTWDGAAWTQLGFDIEGESNSSYFGKAVSLSADGTTVAIGANLEFLDDDGNSGFTGRGRVRMYSLYSQALDITVASVAFGQTLACNISGTVTGTVTGIVNESSGNLHQMGMLKLTHSSWGISNFNNLNDGVVSTGYTYFMYEFGTGQYYNTNYSSLGYANGIALNTQDGGTVTAVVITHSDSRIKMNIEDVPDAVALEQVRQIPCRYYEYKNKIQRGYGKTIGFIAQEVKEVLPMAVKLTTGVIPDHMRPAEVSWEEVDGKHMMTVSNLDADVSSGMKMEFVGRTGTPTERNEDGSVKTPASEDYRECNEVVVMRDNGKFEMKKQYDAVFIIGREVNDKHSVDKAKIFALHHAAIQELDKTVEAQKATIAAQAQELSEQKALIQSLIARMDALEA
jgi:hypothetical protein